MSRDLSRHQQGIVKRYYENHETIQTNKLSEIVSDLYVATDDKTKTRLWGKAQTALMRVCMDANRIASIVGKRDVEALAKLIAELDAKRIEIEKNAVGEGRGIPTGPIAGTTVGESSGGDSGDEGGGESGELPYDSLEEDNLKRALKAFRRRIKNIKRDDESRLGGRYVSAGRASNITAIQPPQEFPAEVWQKLAESGRLKYAGQGTYQLP